MINSHLKKVIKKKIREDGDYLFLGEDGDYILLGEDGDHVLLGILVENLQLGRGWENRTKLKLGSRNLGQCPRRGRGQVAESGSILFNTPDGGNI